MTNQNTHTTAVRRAMSWLHMKRSASDNGGDFPPSSAPTGPAAPSAATGSRRGNGSPVTASARRSKSAMTRSASFGRPRIRR